MSGWLRPRNLVIGGGLLAAVLFVPKPESMNVNIFQTPGQKNIGDAFSRGGGSDVHTPGVATPRGNADNISEPQSHQKGPRSEHFQENQASQRPEGTGTFDNKKFNQANYGADKGK
ncbi:hypothetical protein LTR66_000279 [Elasticomyces elasticus]|nr:hypothetical protein LTR28_005665 [Elasticomyces elasticus]KAK5000933.1 hypothetical protein LTR66_000279 [Elasticomyces elasticus]